MEITAVTSGQDGVFAMQWAAQQKKIQEFEEKYPGLMDILKDPYGSLYLDSDMYKMALRFLRDCVEKNGGELPLAVVYVPTSLEEEMMKAALVYLLPGIDSVRQESFLSVLEARSVANNTYDVPGWDAHLLNEQMLKMLETDCAHTAELIEKEGFYRWSEEHKQSLKIVADSITDFTYSLALYYSMLASQDQVCRKNNLKGASKLKNALKKAFSSDIADDITEAARKTQKAVIESAENSTEGTKGLTNLQKGNYGEMKMDNFFESQGYERISTDRVTDLNAPTHKGIDGVYYNPEGNPPYIIGEAKYGGSTLSTLADGTPQMSVEWIETSYA